MCLLRKTSPVEVVSDGANSVGEEGYHHEKQKMFHLFEDKPHSKGLYIDNPVSSLLWETS